MGVVCTQRDATEFDIIYEKADEELYKDKREGKTALKFQNNFIHIFFVKI